MAGVSLSPRFVRFLPPHSRGQRIGLLGGSFNPAHPAHRLISLIALRRLKLDAVWWLVTPGNPLKSVKGLPAVAQRMQQAHRLANHPKIHVTALESVLRTRYTIDTVQHLRPRCPGVNFVWIMGSDNFLQFHHWKQWPEIAASVPMAVIDRPGTTLKSLHGRAAHRFARQRLPEQRASGLLKRKAPAWVFLHDRRSALSSTLLRSQGL